MSVTADPNDIFELYMTPEDGNKCQILRMRSGEPIPHTYHYNFKCTPWQHVKLVYDRTIDTINEDIDVLAADMLCALIKKDSTLIESCTQMLTSYIKSKDVVVAIKSLELLQECMLKCGPGFQDKVAKYKFLNFFTQLVSNKYKGNQTPKEVRNKIMDLLLLWTTQYPEKEKIKSAYTSLCQEGIKHGLSLSVNPTVNRISFLNEQEEQTLKKLLQSKDKCDIDKANLLIKFYVNQDNKKKNRKILAPSRIQEIEGFVNVLNDLINNWLEERNTSDTETLCIIKEIYDKISEQFKPEITLIIEMLDDCEEELLAQTLEVNCKLLDAIKKYNSEILNASILSSNSMEDLQNNKKNEDVLSDFLGETSRTTVSVTQDTMQVLEGILSTSSYNPHIHVSNLTLLEPTQVFNEGSKTNRNDVFFKLTPSGNSLQDIDKISEDLLKANKSDGEIIGQFKKPPKNLSLNELAKSKVETKEEKKYGETCPNITSMDKLTSNIETKEDSFSTLLEMETPNINSKDSVTTCHNNVDNSNENPDLKVEAQRNSECSSKESKTMYLSEISLDLSKIKPSTINPKTVLDNQELQVIFNFASNKPCPYVSVIVMSIINRNCLPMENYQFDASTRKPCKLRILPPTSNTLPGTEPFKLPAVTIQQILLLYNPTGKPTKITCIVGYNYSDDPDGFKESFSVDLPYFD